MSDVVVRAEGLGKKYLLNHGAPKANSLRDAFGRWFSREKHQVAPATSEDFWALKDVSFEIKRGEVVGIIGRNGAGKSTLLKILSRIIEPTEGRALMRGRVGALLEVGTGFHPELSGRDNIFLNGSVLGLKRAEIARKFDEIVAFSEVERFLDTPVKFYSSGMYMRLAFAVAAHLEPEVLIVDEVLAVGDTQFQKKCLGKMGEVGRQGRTVLFVSHSLQAVSTLTSRSIVLTGGRTSFLGSSDDAIRHYLEDEVPQELSFRGEPHPSEPRILGVSVRTSEPAGIHRHGETFEIEIEVDCPKSFEDGHLGVQIIGASREPIAYFWFSEAGSFREPGTRRMICRVPKLRLYFGHFSLNVHLSGREGAPKYQMLDNICPFEVVMFGMERGRSWPKGVCNYLEDSSWRVEVAAGMPVKQGERR